PYLAQGAAMAIEDAAVLTRALALRATVADALQLYQRNRIERTSKIVKGSDGNRTLFHMREQAELRRAFANRDEGAARNAGPYSYSPRRVELGWGGGGRVGGLGEAITLCVDVVAQGAQVLQRFVERDDVGIFRIEIEQALLVRGARAVADRLAHHHRPQPGLHGIDGGGAHAAAGGAAGDDQGIDALARQPRHQVGAEEAGSI